MKSPLMHAVRNIFSWSHRNESKRGSTQKRSRRSASRSLRCESLEKRELFAITPGELLVNTTTVNQQSESAIAAAPDGRYVAVWKHEFSSSDTDIYAQRFSANGSKVGGQIVVANSSRNESKPDVAMDAKGNFVVTWVDQVSATNTDIKAVRYSSAGVVRGSTIAVANTTKNESSPSIAVDKNGNFVVAWQLQFSATDTDIFARRYLDSGVAVAAAFSVAASSLNESDPDVARSPDGRFAVSYAIPKAAPAFDDGDIMLKRYSASGLLVGTHAIATNFNWQFHARVSMDNNANTIVAWTEEDALTFNTDIKARRVSNSGVLGATISVEVTSAFSYRPDVAVKRDGTGFVVIYSNATAGSIQIAELTASGIVRSRSTIAKNVSSASTPIVFGSGNNFELLYEKSSSVANNKDDIYRRRGVLKLGIPGPT